MVQYSTVFYSKIDQKRPFFSVLAMENATKRSPFSIYFPRCLTHVVCTVIQRFSRHFIANSSEGYKHTALNSNSNIAFRWWGKKSLAAVQDFSRFYWTTLHKQMLSRFLAQFWINNSKWPFKIIDKFRAKISKEHPRYSYQITQRNMLLTTHTSDLLQNFPMSNIYHSTKK